MACTWVRVGLPGWKSKFSPLKLMTNVCRPRLARWSREAASIHASFQGLVEKKTSFLKPEAMTEEDEE